MAIDEADSADATPSDDGAEDASEASPPATEDAVADYSWLDFYADVGDVGDREALKDALSTAEDPTTPTRADFDRAGLSPEDHLGFDPAGTEQVLEAASHNAVHISEYVRALQAGDTPVVKGWYSWEDYKEEYFYDEEGDPPTDSDGEPETFDPEPTLGFDPDDTENALAAAGDAAEQLDALVDERTVDVSEELDEDAFFSTEAGATTVVNRYDLEKSVPQSKKSHFREVDRYWVNEPYAFVILFKSVKENEHKYYLIEPHMNEIEDDLTEFLTGKLRASIKYSEQGVDAEDESMRREVIRDEMYALLERYDLYARERGGGTLDTAAERLGVSSEDSSFPARVLRALGWNPVALDEAALEGIEARPESAVVAEDNTSLTEYQVEKLLYYLRRDFIGYERIDGIKHDINVEDISCDGYNSPVFVYHSDHEQIITNVYHGTDELDDFVVKLAQRSGKGISKRSPQVDATLPDGSRAQLTLGREVSDHGTNYTIRQFKEVPFTPIDLINWKTFSLEEMAYLWLCIENHKSLIFAGGTASGKTTSLNAVSLFIPSNSKIVSIEDTREVELPQRNWIASVTRPSFTEDDKGDVDEFDLLEAALRQRPDYIVMGEIRGEEGRTLFQVMSTGHTTYTTFHADSVGEVLKRFTTEPINVSKTMFTALDLVSIQSSTRVDGRKVRRNKNITEINHYDAENNEINVRDIYQWEAETDEFVKMGNSNTLNEIKFDRGWSQNTLDNELFLRKTVLAYLIENGLNTYTQVAATFQAFISDPDTILTLMANGGLEESLEDLREMESVYIDIDPEMEAMVPRPDADEARLAEAADILEEADERVFESYRGESADSIAMALMTEHDPDVEASPADTRELDSLEATFDEDGFEEDAEAGAAVGDEAPRDDRSAADPTDVTEDEVLLDGLSNGGSDEAATSTPAAESSAGDSVEFGDEPADAEATPRDTGAASVETPFREPAADADAAADGDTDATADGNTDATADGDADTPSGTDVTDVDGTQTNTTSSDDATTGGFAFGDDDADDNVLDAEEAVREDDRTASGAGSDGDEDGVGSEYGDAAGETDGGTEGDDTDDTENEDKIPFDFGEDDSAPSESTEPDDWNFDEHDGEDEE